MGDGRVSTRPLAVAGPSRPDRCAHPFHAQERDGQGRPMYNNEVFIRDLNIRSLVDEAVINAMANKGVYTAQTAASAQQAGQYVGQVVQTQPANQMNRSFDNPTSTVSPPPVQTVQSVPQFQQVTQAAVPPVVTPPVQQPSSTTVWDEDLPF